VPLVVDSCSEMLVHGTELPSKQLVVLRWDASRKSCPSNMWQLQGNKSVFLNPSAAMTAVADFR
jgi:hypothetical protein